MSAFTFEFSITNALWTLMASACVACCTVRLIQSDLSRRFQSFREVMHQPQPALIFLEEQRHEVEKLRVEIAARMEHLEGQFERLAQRLRGAD